MCALIKEYTSNIKNVVVVSFCNEIKNNDISKQVIHLILDQV